MKTLSPSIMNLPWHVNAAEYWFSALSNDPWAMLLHSGYSNHYYGRFDIFVADPIGTLITRDKITKILMRKNEIITSSEDPFNLLNEVLHSCNFYTTNNANIPFQGGALGLFGYDLARCFEKIPQYALRDINIPDMAIGIYDWAFVADHHQKHAYLLCYSNIDKRFLWLKKRRKNTFSHLFRITTWQSNMNAEEYEKKFNRIQGYIKNGDCYQVNLAQRFQAHYKGDEWQAFTYLNKKNRAPFSAFLRFKEGAVLSFSPERLVQLFNRHIQTRPIKGTLPRCNSIEEDNQQILRLKNSCKDRSENLMIVDLMRNDIGRVAEPGSVQVPELFSVESFSVVHHLVSTITARLSSLYSSCDLLRAVFPGGSVTGAPKIRAMEIIEELEPHRRNAWCGSIGYLSFCGSMDMNIAIRTLTAFDGVLYCSAGGGIISESRLQTEYQETFNKIRNILECLEQKN